MGVGGPDGRDITAVPAAPVALGRTTSAARKPSKGTVLRWAQRAVLRPNIGMLILTFICAAVFIPYLRFSTVYVQRIVYLPTQHFLIPDGADDGESGVSAEDGEIGVNRMSTFRHPCENFEFPPPPPPDGKRTGPRPCPVCYAPPELAMSLMPESPSESPVVKKLEYVAEDFSAAPVESDGGSPFGGYPSLKQRSDSFDLRESMTVNCGFVRGNRPGQGTGFDIDDADLLEMERCGGVVVASAIFGNYDVMQQPRNIHERTKRSVCFYMFVDEETEAFIKNTTIIDSELKVGLWRIVVAKNLPYIDERRNGKVPKLLLHRLFPNARYSLWIDGKLELSVDPYQILERFLWREKASFAISSHYKRFDVFEEAEANKAAGKYNNASIDSQIDFYIKEGLTPYSSMKLPITSDVPEGCVIIREHIPITNLFTCLWFNEVDRFTSRDQLSFGIVRDKIMSRADWSVNMFKDCERRNFVTQTYHRDLLEKMSTVTPSPPVSAKLRPDISGDMVVKMLPVFSVDKVPRPPGRRPPARHWRDRRSGPRRHHPRDVHSRGGYSV